MCSAGKRWGVLCKKQVWSSSIQLRQLCRAQSMVHGGWLAWLFGVFTPFADKAVVLSSKLNIVLRATSLLL